MRHWSDQTGAHNLFDIGCAGKNLLNSLLKQDRHAAFDGFQLDCLNGLPFDDMTFYFLIGDQ